MRQKKNSNKIGLVCNNAVQDGESEWLLLARNVQHAHVAIAFGGRAVVVVLAVVAHARLRLAANAHSGSVACISQVQVWRRAAIWP